MDEIIVASASFLVMRLITQQQEASQQQDVFVETDAFEDEQDENIFVEAQRHEDVFDVADAFEIEQQEDNSFEAENPLETLQRAFEVQRQGNAIEAQQQHQRKGAFEVKRQKDSYEAQQQKYAFKAQQKKVNACKAQPKKVKACKAQQQKGAFKTQKQKSALKVQQRHLAKPPRRRRRLWMTKLFQSRDARGDGHKQSVSMEELHLQTSCHMSLTDFEALMNLVGPKIGKTDTCLRKAIPAAVRLTVTLRFLASGDPYSSLSVLFKISKQTISTIVPEVCAALIDGLKDFVKMPQTPQEWLQVAEEYETKWNFPNCIGGIDGKYCAIQCPSNTGNESGNDKSLSDVVIFGLVDADYCFIDAEVCCQGRIPDGSGVFRNTEFFKNMENGTLNIPNARNLPGRHIEVPYVFVANDVFPLNDHIMKPYSGQQPESSREHIFNYRLSRARRIVQNALGLLSSVFRVLRRPKPALIYQSDKAKTVIMACVHLHNFLRKSSSSRQIYTREGVLDCEENGNFTPGSWRNEEATSITFMPFMDTPGQSSEIAQDVRDEFAAYFMSEGRIPFQDKL